MSSDFAAPQARDRRRTARCSCGAVSVEARGAPAAVVACHCIECQRRTGAPFGVGAYYPQSEVQINGATTGYSRPTDSGAGFVSHFCPSCGSTVFWYPELRPGFVGIAVGAFGDPQFPAPVRSVWEQSMHEWVHVGSAQQHFPKARV
jgi:hypothetical protein